MASRRCSPARAIASCITDPFVEIRDRIADSDRRQSRRSRTPIALRSAMSRSSSTLEACVAEADSSLKPRQNSSSSSSRYSPRSSARRRADAILASNTSVIPIGQIMSSVSDKHRARSARTGGIRPISCRWSKSSARPKRPTRRSTATMDAAEDASARRRSRSRKTSRISSATACSTRCGARRSLLSPKGSATPRQSTTSSNQASARVWPCLVRWRTPISSARN